MIDIHSHIMPEIDDGARSLDEALEMASIAAADGIDQMVSTPHIFNGLSNDQEPSEILDRVARLQEAIGDKLKILPGNEVHISHEIVDHARNNRVMKINRKNYMLVELPQLSIPFRTDDLLWKLLEVGVQPILVHPERNAEIQRRPAILTKLIERGVLIQVTAMSVTGEFGRAAKACADTLLKHNCVHFLATDTHRPTKRAPILSKGRDAAAAIVGEEKAHRLVVDNPLAVINGEPLLPESPLPFDSQKPSLSRFFRKGSLT
jgi:protein-tyrosine phosphatase